MNLIRPSFEIWEQGYNLDSIWSHIARCTRVCYQSIPKNDSETDEEFVKRVILRPDSSTGRLDFDKIHGAMLEHGTVYLIHRADEDGPGLDKYDYNKYSKFVYKDFNSYVTTNLRVIYENNWLNDLKYICAPTEHHAKRITVSFTTNIGVTREFNRHRVNSIAEESTRYCNYNKIYNGQLNIALPAWLLGEEHLPYIESHQFDKLSSYCEDILGNESLIDNWCDIDYYLFSLTVAEFCYNSLIEKGWKPQQAREVLPLATKSQLIHTAFVDDWKHFFALRSKGVSGLPHPNAKLIAKPLEEEFIKRGYI